MEKGENGGIRLNMGGSSVWSSGPTWEEVIAKIGDYSEKWKACQSL
jgi:hypothetical protein